MGEIEGIRFGNPGIRVSLLLFADDSMLFVKANESNMEAVRRCLGLYEQAARQKVNFDKSVICFGQQIEEMKQQRIVDVLGVKVTDNLDKYLGLPIFSGKSCSHS